MSQIRSTELKISNFLSLGVLFCGMIIFCGWIFKLKLSGNPFFNFEMYDRISLTQLLMFYCQKKDWAQLISYGGLSLLICIPFMRLLMMIYFYLKTKEYVLTLISVCVLMGLIGSLALGIQS